MLIFILYIVSLTSQTVIPNWDMGMVNATGEQKLYSKSIQLLLPDLFFLFTLVIQGRYK